MRRRAKTCENTVHETLRHSREVLEHFGSGADQIESLFGSGAVIQN